MDDRQLPHLSSKVTTSAVAGQWAAPWGYAQRSKKLQLWQELRLSHVLSKVTTSAAGCPMGSRSATADNAALVRAAACPPVVEGDDVSGRLPGGRVSQCRKVLRDMRKPAAPPFHAQAGHDEQLLAAWVVHPRLLLPLPHLPLLLLLLLRRGGLAIGWCGRRSAGAVLSSLAGTEGASALHFRRLCWTAEVRRL